jgi:hypothetical protein
MHVGFNPCLHTMVCVLLDARKKPETHRSMLSQCGHQQAIPQQQNQRFELIHEIMNHHPNQDQINISRS